MSLKQAIEIASVSDEIRPLRLMEQIVASAVSIPSNIAEGSQMNTNIHFLKYLRISSGSAAELETQLLVLLGANKYKVDNVNNWIKTTNEIKAMLNSLIYSLSKAE